MGNHLMAHGDGVKDVSFSVLDLEAIIQKAKEKGCKIDKDIWEETDQFGKVVFRTCRALYFFLDLKYSLNLKIR